MTTNSVFTDVDYNSSNGMCTSIWGPIVWTSLHLISFNYPVNPTTIDKKNYKEWFLSYQNTLPCIYCRQNFKKNLASANFSSKDLANRETFSRFIYKLHNTVNIMLGKPKYLTYEEVRDIYENFRSRCSETERTKVMKEKEKNLKYEKKCEGSLYGIQSKSIIKIVPKNYKIKVLSIDPKCKTKRRKKTSKKK